jgi:BirA family biotin operon repressor/biotin-[acetyl-CoA-carboxylase] ligase
LQNFRPPAPGFGSVIFELYETPSTNMFAHDLLKSQVPQEGTVVITENQTKGKGQYNTVWESEPGSNLTFSLILYPDFLPADQQFLLNQAIALGVYDYVSQFFGGQVTIKWPNDIYVNNDKIAGILIENSLTSNMISSTVAGIGININQQVFSSAILNPTSFRMLTGQHFNIMECLSGVCRCIENRYRQLKEGRFNLLHSAFTNAMFRYREMHPYRRNGEIFYGRIVGVNPQGLLMLEVNEMLRTFNLKEIAFIV